jgi:hypothetical protein
MLAFLTGDISGISDFDRFKAAERELLSKRIWTISITNILDEGPFKKINDREYKIARLKYLLKSDKVIFMKGYEKSALAIREYAIAEYLNTPIEVYYDKDFD